MLEMRFDFSTIACRTDFYRCFAAQSGVGDHFGANLDALWDALTGDIALPARIVLCHAPSPDQSGELAAIFDLLEEAQQTLQGALALHYC